MSLAAVSPIEAGLAAQLPGVGPAATPGASFADLLMQGIDGVERKLVEADRLAARFALDDSIPLHQVTYALEEARLSVELMMQVRARLVDAYQRMMDMQI